MHEFKNVSTQMFRLNGCIKGMTEYVPTTFKGVYFSVSHGILHAALTNYKWREKPLVHCDDDLDDNGIYIETTGKLDQHEREQLELEFAYLPGNLQDYLLASKSDFYEKHKTNNQRIEMIFDLFVSPLIQNWENLKRSYETILTDQSEVIYENTKPLNKIEPQNEDLDFCGIKGWKCYKGEESKNEAEKENQPIEVPEITNQDQSTYKYDSDEEGNLNISDEQDGIIQKVYSSVIKYKEFYLNYLKLKNAFVERVKTKNPNALTKNIEQEINVLAGQIAQ